MCGCGCSQCGVQIVKWDENWCMDGGVVNLVGGQCGMQIVSGVKINLCVDGGAVNMVGKIENRDY